MLNVDSVDVFYGGIQALREVSVAVEEGEMVAIIGANGAGKSTLLRCISGLVRARRGRIVFKGRDITRLPPDQVAAMGIAHVPEGRRVFANLSVLENLLVGAHLARSRSEVAARLRRVYELFPWLEGRAHQKAGTLSGGEQQMLVIGRALMSDPTLVLMDEPSLGLAPALVKAVFGIIRELNASGRTVLLVEQNASQALTLAHRAYVLQTGRVMLSGTGRELLDNPMVKAAYLGRQVARRERAAAEG